MMSLIRRLLPIVSFVAACPALVFALQPPSQQNEFVPMDKLPPADQLPAAPLLIAAYAFVWIALMFYLWTIWRRLSKIEADIRTLESKSRGSVR